METHIPESKPSRRWPCRLAASTAAALAVLSFTTTPTAHAGLALPADTVAYYAFNTSTDLGLDSSSNLNHLQNKGGTPTHNGSGKFGGAMSMTGNSYMNLPGDIYPATLNLGTDPYSVSVWIKPTGTGDNPWIHWGAWGAVNIRFISPNTVSYTHLTLPTKRIV